MWFIACSALALHHVWFEGPSVRACGVFDLSWLFLGNYCIISFSWTWFVALSMYWGPLVLVGTANSPVSVGTSSVLVLMSHPLSKTCWLYFLVVKDSKYVVCFPLVIAYLSCWQHRLNSSTALRIESWLWLVGGYCPTVPNFCPCCLLNVVVIFSLSDKWLLFGCVFVIFVPAFVSLSCFSLTSLSW